MFNQVFWLQHSVAFPRHHGVCGFAAHPFRPLSTPAALLHQPPDRVRLPARPNRRRNYVGDPGHQAAVHREPVRAAVQRFVGSKLRTSGSSPGISAVRTYGGFATNIWKGPATLSRPSARSQVTRRLQAKTAGVERRRIQCRRADVGAKPGGLRQLAQQGQQKATGPVPTSRMRSGPRHPALLARNLERCGNHGLAVGPRIEGRGEMAKVRP